MRSLLNILYADLSIGDISREDNLIDQALEKMISKIREDNLKVGQLGLSRIQSRMSQAFLIENELFGALTLLKQKFNSLTPEERFELKSKISKLTERYALYNING